AHAYRTTPFERQANVFHLAQFCSRDRTHVLAPLPPRLVAGPANCHAADGHQFQLALFKFAFFVRLLKFLQKDVVHRSLRDTHLQKLESVIPSGARRGGRSRGTMRLLFPKLYKTAEISPPPPGYTCAANARANAIAGEIFCARISGEAPGANNAAEMAYFAGAEPTFATPSEAPISKCAFSTSFFICLMKSKVGRVSYCPPTSANLRRSSKPSAL